MSSVALSLTLVFQPVSRIFTRVRHVSPDQEPVYFMCTRVSYATSSAKHGVVLKAAVASNRTTWMLSIFRGSYLTFDLMQSHSRCKKQFISYYGIKLIFFYFDLLSLVIRSRNSSGGIATYWTTEGSIPGSDIHNRMQSLKIYIRIYRTNWLDLHEVER